MKKKPNYWIKLQKYEIMLTKNIFKANVKNN